MAMLLLWWHIFGVLRGFCGFRAASLNQVLSVGDWQYCSQTLRVIFVGLRSFSCFSAQGSELGGEVGPTQKATLFPSGSALHPIMNGVLKNITLGTRLFFIPHNWAVCPRVLSGVSRQMRQPSAVLVLEWPPPQLGAERYHGPAGGGGSGLQVGRQMKVQRSPSFPDCCVFVR